jgi:hypothetical protein
MCLRLAIPAKCGPTRPPDRKRGIIPTSTSRRLTLNPTTLVVTLTRDGGLLQAEGASIYHEACIHPEAAVSAYLPELVARLYSFGAHESKKYTAALHMVS